MTWDSNKLSVELGKNVILFLAPFSLCISRRFNVAYQRINTTKWYAYFYDLCLNSLGKTDLIGDIGDIGGNRFLFYYLMLIPNKLFRNWMI